MRRIGMRAADQETARVVAIRGVGSRYPVGAGCLVSADTVLTCLHVVAAATRQRSENVKHDDKVDVRMFGFSEPITRMANVAQIGSTRALHRDLVLLKLAHDPKEELVVPNAEFATPLRHGGKAFSVLGFPGGREQGRNASGILNAMDALGLVQMNKGSEALEVEPGYSGAPVWCPDVGAFVGLVVTEQRHRGVSWCIPSRLLSQFYQDLHVTFRVPPSDRPAIHDYGEDDPNKWLFGELEDDGLRRFSARVKENTDDDYDSEYKVSLKYECLACVNAEDGNKGEVLSNLRLAFQRKSQLLKGEQMPDPRADPSFQRYLRDDDFLKLMKVLGLK